jgi:hypothetical protein
VDRGFKKSTAAQEDSMNTTQGKMLMAFSLAMIAFLLGAFASYDKELVVIDSPDCY